MKNEECIRAERKDHQGNFKISVSFDIYGQSSIEKIDTFVSRIEKAIKREFESYKYFNTDFKIKNIKWNE